MEPKELAFVALLVALPTALAFATLWLSHVSKRIVIVGTVATIALLVSFHCLTLDGLDGFVFKRFTPDDTQLAAKYSAIGFWEVHEGMTPDQVKALVGPPLESYSVAGGYAWRWSRSPHDSNYRVRVVVFVAGRVFEKSSEYYLD